MESIKKLELQLKENTKKSLEIRNKIEELKAKEVLPKIKEQYEGRYWKYINSCCDGESWLLYSFCIKVEKEYEGIFNSFETTPYESKFNDSIREGFILCQEEITRDEYMQALQEFKKRLESLET